MWTNIGRMLVLDWLSSILWLLSLCCFLYRVDPCHFHLWRCWSHCCFLWLFICSDFVSISFVMIEFAFETINQDFWLMFQNRESTLMWSVEQCVDVDVEENYTVICLIVVWMFHKQHGSRRMKGSICIRYVVTGGSQELVCGLFCILSLHFRFQSFCVNQKYSVQLYKNEQIEKNDPWLCKSEVL